MINRKGKIYISGGGNAKDTLLLDREFANLVRGQKLLYLPTGLVRDFIGYEECYEWLCQTLLVHVDNIDISMWTDLKDKSINELSSFKAIYIGGGSNTYRLLNIFYKTGFINILFDYFCRGGNIYGGSAGAVIIGRNIATVSEENDKGYVNEKGMNLLADHSVFCHYDITLDGKIRKYIAKYNNPVIALPERCGIIVDNNEVSVIGYDVVSLFNLEGCKVRIEPRHCFVL